MEFLTFTLSIVSCHLSGDKSEGQTGLLTTDGSGLKMVVDRTDFRENIRLEVLSASKDELMEDFEDAPDVTKSGLLILVTI